MLDSRPGAHDLNITGRNGGLVALAVFVRQRPADDIGNNFHVPMPVPAKAHAGRHPVVINHAQMRKTHVRRIVVISEGKTVVAL